MELVKALSDGEIEQIRDRTEEVLETVGLRVEHPVLRRMPRGRRGGGRAGRAGALPAAAAARAAGKRAVELRPPQPGRQGRGGWRGEQYAHAIVTDPWIVDYETQKPRRPCLDDVRRHTVIAQKLDPISSISLMDFPVTDVPEPNSCLRAFEEHVLHHDKHIYIYATNEERYEDWLNVVRILGARMT